METIYRYLIEFFILLLRFQSFYSSFIWDFHEYALISYCVEHPCIKWNIWLIYWVYIYEKLGSIYLIIESMAYYMPSFHIKWEQNPIDISIILLLWMRWLTHVLNSISNTQSVHRFWSTPSLIIVWNKIILIFLMKVKLKINVSMTKIYLSGSHCFDSSDRNTKSYFI